MASNRRYRDLVPPAVQQFEADNHLYEADWYVPSAANPGVYSSEFARLFPGPSEHADEQAEYEGVLPQQSHRIGHDGDD
ncbi:MAG TPA: hypothetical protein VGO14_08485 [Solirubrobacteraceae bacterium]|jgi:hypothetical protein|nr:hypothetical protein [Solirubrobacteraceae bacterium]